ncbi:MAG: hypothetical protein AAF726_08185 [Planctomycetota bacterium]
MLLRRLASLSLLAVAAPALAQSPITFAIDPVISQFSFGGSTSLGPIVGMPPNFGLSGTVVARLTAGTTQPVHVVQLLNGGDALVSPDLSAEIPNPVPFLPPLAAIDITNLRLALRSNPVAVDTTGQFTIDIVSTALSGTATVTPAFGMPSVTDLTGLTSLPQTFQGTIVFAGAQTIIEGPLSLSFLLSDPMSGLTANLDVMGNFAAVGSQPAPANYCTAEPNSTGGPAAISTTGSPSLFSADLALTADQLPTFSLGYFLFSETQDFVPGFGGSAGNLCIGGSIFRLSNFVLGSGPVGAVSLPVPFGGLPPAAAFDIGESWNFQYWFRDSVGGSTTSNTTDGVTVEWTP